MIIIIALGTSHHVAKRPLQPPVLHRGHDGEPANSLSGSKTSCLIGPALPSPIRMAVCSTMAPLLASQRHPKYPFFSHACAARRCFFPVLTSLLEGLWNQSIVVSRCPSEVYTTVSTRRCDIDCALLATFVGTPYIYPVTWRRRTFFSVEAPLYCTSLKYCTSFTAIWFIYSSLLSTIP
jgi:hypothetical protein